METKGPCCITNSQTHHISEVHTIMLRFRPIAPKPLPAALPSDASSSESVSRSAAPKRKRAKPNTNRCTRRRNAHPQPPPPPPPPPTPPTTLPLLPETPVPKKTASGESNRNAPVWLSFGRRGGVAASADPFCFGRSVVTVECVTETWREEDERLGFGSGDEERKVKLEEDTCPGFISDGYGRVTWTNGAYREVVGEGGVWLAMKVSVAYPWRGFTCWVRVQYACGKERTVPCDVWRMDSGGFAWRLDVKAALTLTLAL